MNSYENKTVLITGATGLIGNNLVDAFMKMRNVNVIALGRNEVKLRDEFSSYLSNELFSYCIQDISDPINLRQKVDFIFHAAGSMERSAINSNPVDVIKPNILGVINCLEFLKKQKEDLGVSGRLVVFSSITIYANLQDNDISVTEDETNYACKIDSSGAAYSESKRMIEVITNAYVKQYSIDAVIARFSTVYGPTRIMPNTAFYEFVKNHLEKKRISVNTPGLPRRDNIFISDAIDGVILVGLHGECGEAYNISSNGDLGNYASISEIAQIIVDTSNGGTVLLSPSEKAIKRKPGIKLDNRKLKSLGWEPTVSLGHGIAKTINYFEERMKKKEPEM